MASRRNVSESLHRGCRGRLVPSGCSCPPWQLGRSCLHWKQSRGGSFRGRTKETAGTRPCPGMFEKPKAEAALFLSNQLSIESFQVSCNGHFADNIDALHDNIPCISFMLIDCLHPSPTSSPSPASRTMAVSQNLIKIRHFSNFIQISFRLLCPPHLSHPYAPAVALAFALICSTTSGYVSYVLVPSS